ncbi:hypothetical protein [Sphingomonas cavernae]|nr:hypothetical protein [Sphingomonas cavernae]
MEELQALLASDEFEEVRAQLEALEPLLLVDQRIGPHLMAFRTGMFALAGMGLTPAEPTPPPAEPVP